MKTKMIEYEAWLEQARVTVLSFGATVTGRRAPERAFDGARGGRPTHFVLNCYEHIGFSLFGVSAHSRTSGLKN